MLLQGTLQVVPLALLITDFNAWQISQSFIPNFFQSFLEFEPRFQK